MRLDRVGLNSTDAWLERAMNDRDAEPDIMQILPPREAHRLSRAEKAIGALAIGAAIVFVYNVADDAARHFGLPTLIAVLALSALVALGAHYLPVLRRRRHQMTGAQFLHLNDVQPYLRDYYSAARPDREVLLFVGMDRLGVVVFVREIRGDRNSVPFDQRQVIADALKASVYQMAMYHNHPSGDPSPSRADTDATESVAAACRAVGIQLVEHAILALDPDGNLVDWSYRRHGRLF